jgi:hypothetical protein
MMIGKRRNTIGFFDPPGRELRATLSPKTDILTAEVND